MLTWQVQPTATRTHPVLSSELLAGSAVPCFVISGALHGPHYTHAQSFFRALVQSVGLAKEPGKPARCVAEILKPGIEKLDWTQWATPFDCWSAEHLILEEMYRRCQQLYMSPSSTTEEDYFQGVVVNVNEEPGANFTTNPLVMMEKQDAAPGSEQPGYEPNTPSVKHEQINLF